MSGTAHRLAQSWAAPPPSDGPASADGLQTCSSLPALGQFPEQQSELLVHSRPTTTHGPHAMVGEMLLFSARHVSPVGQSELLLHWCEQPTSSPMPATMATAKSASFTGGNATRRSLS